MIIFNFMGFEVITTVSGDMDNPDKDIPKALIIGGILIAFFYLFSTFGILFYLSRVFFQSFLETL